MRSYLKAVDDTHILDHALQTLKQLRSTLHANSSSPEDEAKLVPFVPVVYFSPAEKSETQPKFKKLSTLQAENRKLSHLCKVLQLNYPLIHNCFSI